MIVILFTHQRCKDSKKDNTKAKIECEKKWFYANSYSLGELELGINTYLLLIFGKNGWETANYDTVDMTKVQVGTKLLAFMVNGEKTTGADTNTFTASNHDVINGANAADDLDEMVITYDAIVAPQAAALTDAEVANVVFTIGWDAQ